MMPNNRFNAVSQIVFAFFVLPALVVTAWWKAWQFDPYTMRFFSKTYVAPTPEMPEEMRFVGWVLVVIGGIVGYAGVRGIVKRIGKLHMSVLVLWVGCLVAGFGGAFFVAADAAHVRIVLARQA